MLRRTEKQLGCSEANNLKVTFDAKEVPIHESSEVKERQIKQEYIAEIFKEKTEKYLRVGEIVKEIAQRRTSKRMGSS